MGLPRGLIVGLVAVLLMAIAAPVSAHFRLNVNIRIFHVAPMEDGLRLYLRLPTAYLASALLGPEQTDGTRRDITPYTIGVWEDGVLNHRFDVDAFMAAPMKLGSFVADGHHLAIAGAALVPELRAVRIYSARAQPPFATLAEARRAFTIAYDAEAVRDDYVGDTVIDVIIDYRFDDAVKSYSLSGLLDPALPEQDQTANLLIDHHGETPRFYRIRGLLDEPVQVVVGSIWRAAASFIIAGMRHILEGLDHVLYVLCLTLGASSLRVLAWRVSGFTLGHSLTLMAGFFGYAPSGSWFVALVETLIALSIIHAAMLVIVDRGAKSTGSVVVLIGLLHGLGFSFVLSTMLASDAPHLWTSLGAFNIGVELGQLAIVSVIGLALWLLSLWSSSGVVTTTRMAVAFPCLVVAAYWVGARGLTLLEAF